MDFFTEKEWEVAEILRTMAAIHRRPWPQQLISPSKSHWVTKRRRSTIAKPSKTSALPPPPQPQPQPPSSSKMAVADVGLTLESVKREGTCKAVTRNEESEFSGQLPQVQPNSFVATPIFSLDRQKQAPTLDQFHRHPQQQQQLQRQQPRVKPTRFLNLADTGGWNRIPDLNARVDENGEVVQDDSAQVHQERVVVDPTKVATAEARKRRIEIYRRRRKAVGDGGSARTAVHVGITAV